MSSDTEEMIKKKLKEANPNIDEKALLTASTYISTISSTYDIDLDKVMYLIEKKPEELEKQLEDLERERKDLKQEFKKKLAKV